MANDAFAGLAPAAVGYAGVYVGIKAVFVGRCFNPRGGRHVLDQADGDQAFGVFETIFPWHHQAHRGTVLVGQDAAIHAKGQQGQGVQGFVQAQAFGVGPVQAATAQAGHVLGVGLGDKFDELGAAQGLHLFEQCGQRVAHPGDDHAPAFDAAQAVDALFHGLQAQQVFQRPGARFLHQALNAYAPGAGWHRGGVAGGVGLVVAKFIKVVVAGGIVPGGGLGGQLRAGHGGGFAGQGGEFVHGCGCGHGFARCPGAEAGGGAGGCQQLQQAAAFGKDVLRGNRAGGGLGKPGGSGMFAHENSFAKIDQRLPVYSLWYWAEGQVVTCPSCL